MKESIGSLRAFFCIIGGLGVLGGIFTMMACLAVMALAPVIGISLLIWVGINLVLSMAYLYCGIKLPVLLDTKVDFVLKVIMISLAMSVIGLGVSALLGGLNAQTLAQTGFSFLISIYLLNSGKRLKSDRANRPEAEEGQPGFSRF